MVIISHDRHFLNGVCTHMSDLDYGALKTFPGNYDDFMIAATASYLAVLGVKSLAWI
jgi:ATPase subunit of ABC transporter with duplicated ATPase domains